MDVRLSGSKRLLRTQARAAKAERMRTDCFTRRKIIYFKDSASSLFLFSTVALPNINQVTKQENIQENILLSYSFPMIFKQLLKGDL